MRDCEKTQFNSRINTRIHIYKYTLSLKPIKTGKHRIKADFK